MKGTTAEALLFLLLADLGMASDNQLTEQAYDEYSERQTLAKILLENYDPFQVPSKNSNMPVNVTITMWPYDILQVNEAKSSIMFSGWLDLRWIDYNLQWKPEAHSNITHLFIPASQLWLPSVDIFYRKDVTDAERCKDCYIKVDASGETLWGQYFSFSFPCAINTKYFPFDMQYCEMELANWYLDDRMMDLYPRDSAVALDLSVFLPNVEWDLVNVTVIRKREFFNYGYFPSLAYRLYIKRKPFFYVTVLVIPSLVITITAVIGFHSPSSGSGLHQEKIQMGVTAVLSVFILQLGVADKLPPTSDVVPLIGIYYTWMVMILSLSIVSSAFIIVIEKQGIYGKPIPDWVQLIFLWRTRPNHHTEEPPKRSTPDGACAVEQTKNMLYCKGRRVSEQLLKRTRSNITNNESPWQSHLRDQSSLSDCYSAYRSCEADLGNTKRKTTPPNCSGTAEDDWSKVFSQTLAEIRTSVQNLERKLQEHERKQQIRRDWSTLADVVERISLAFFISSCFVSLLMFFYHGWY